jgi:type VI secretion system secreted protein Hcp
LISVFAAALVLPLAALGISVAAGSSSAPPALDSSVVVTAVFPASAGIPGGGSPAGHGADGIEVSSWSWGVSNSSGSTGGGAGKVKFNEFTIKKTVDSASPLFFRAVAQGQHYHSVILYFDEAPGSSGASGTPPTYATYMTITLTNVFISADAIFGGAGGSSSGDRPTESITLNFAKVQMTYSPQGAAPTSFSGGPSSR